MMNPNFANANNGGTTAEDAISPLSSTASPSSLSSLDNEDSPMLTYPIYDNTSSSTGKTTSTINICSNGLHPVLSVVPSIIDSRQQQLDIANFNHPGRPYVQINDETRARLQPNQWLNDELINFVLLWTRRFNTTTSMKVLMLLLDWLAYGVQNVAIRWKGERSTTYSARHIEAA